MAEYTPGPWGWEPEIREAEFDQYKDLASLEPRPQSIVWTHMDGAASTWIVVNEADAHLIAAAPDPLNAADLLATAFEDFDDIKNMDAADFKDKAALTWRAVEAARAAIAKATRPEAS